MLTKPHVSHYLPPYIRATSRLCSFPQPPRPFNFQICNKSHALPFIPFTLHQHVHNSLTNSFFTSQNANKDVYSFRLHIHSPLSTIASGFNHLSLFPLISHSCLSCQIWEYPGRILYTSSPELSAKSPPPPHGMSFTKVTNISSTHICKIPHQNFTYCPPLRLRYFVHRVHSPLLGSLNFYRFLDLFLFFKFPLNLIRNFPPSLELPYLHFIHQY
jgi:hypothetical protein